MLNILAISNYRSLRNLVVPLAALNLITGPNGSGKSNVYRALRPMMPQSGLLAAYPDRNALVIVDRSANVRRLVEVIKILENSPKSTVEWSPPKTSEKP
jgi:predicted ATPase